jgi:hypothetical protein
MRELLQAVLDESGPFVLHEHYAIPAILATGIVVIILSSMSRLKRFVAWMMIAVWVFVALWIVLDAIETFVYDRIYFYFLIMVPMNFAPSLLLSATGLILYRIQRRREARHAVQAGSDGGRREPVF